MRFAVHANCSGRPVNSTLTAREGGFIALSCDITGTNITWDKDGKSITSYDGEVWLFNVDISDQGEYSCSQGDQVSNYLLLVHGKHLSPTQHIDTTTRSNILYVEISML